MDFGFLFCRVMNFYSTPYAQAMDLPLRTFWMMSNNINRISAEKDIRALSVHAAAGGEDGFKQANKALKQELGEVIVSRAESGLSKLKGLMGRMRREDARRN